MKCSNCGNILNNGAKTCPYCGANIVDNKKVNKKRLVILILLAVVAVLLLIAAIVVSIDTNKSNVVINPDNPGQSVEYEITDEPVETDNISDEDEGTNKRVIMVYMIGSNLESEYGCASQDIQEMLSAKLDKNTQIYIYAGGSKRWSNQSIDSTKNNIYTINNHKLVLKQSYEKSNMGDVNTLSTFIKYVQSNTKSNNYSLIFWDHGGGPIVGYGPDELFEDRLLLRELYAALKDSNFKGNNKLEFIGFDACLMGNIEIASYLSEFSNYLIASEETEPGAGWDYNAFSNISKLNTEKLGKKIIDAYVDSQNVMFDGYTLSMVKLSDMPKIVNKLNSVFSSLNAQISTKYESVARSRISSLEFGKSTPEQSLDLIDIVDFLEYYGDSEFKNLAKDIEKTIVYNKSNLSKAKGLTIYFPYTNQAYAKRFLDMYKDFGSFESYYKFISSFQAIQKGESRTSWDFVSNKTSYDNNSLSIELTNEQMKNYSKAYYVIFEKNDDGTYTPVYRNTNFKRVGNKLVSQYNKKVLYVYDNKDKGTTTIIHVKDTNKGSLYYAPVVTMKYGADGLMSENFESSSGWLRLMIKNNKVNELGIVPSDSSGDLPQSTKILWQLKDWNSVQFTNFRYYILDENGKYTTDWKSAKDYYLFEVLPKKHKVSFKMGNLDKKKEYYAVINVRDMQSKVYSSDLIKVQ